jgi:subtilisin family serine protease
MLKYFRFIIGLTLVLILCALAAIPDRAIAQDLPLFEDKSPSAGSTLEYVPDAIIVKFKSGVILPARVEQAEATGISSIDTLVARFEVRRISQLFINSSPPTDPARIDLSRFYRVEFPQKFNVQEVSSAFLQNPFIESAEVIGIHPVFPTHPNDTFYSSPYYYQWNFHNTGQDILGNVGTADADVDAPEAWDLTHGSSSVKLAIVDTGVDWQHPDLGGSSPYISGNIWTNLTEYYGTTSVDDDGNGYVDDIRGWDWVDGIVGAAPGEDASTPDNNPMDFNGHGTHCAGLASAITNNGVGVAGLGWGCQIMALRVGWEDAFGNGYVAMDFCAQAIYYATLMGATAINCSWGSSNSGGIAAAVDNAISNGVVVVVAAGNDNSETQDYLASRGDCIDVAATDNDDIRASFSNYGTWVDVSTPGWYVASTYYDHDTSSHTYLWMAGTSMAAPQVVGLAGLLKSYYPSITGREIKQRIYHTTDNIDSLNPGYEGKLGSGRINAYKALTLYWSSYSDSGHSTPCDNFDMYPEENIVFMHGASFLASHQYRVAYYDGIGAKVAEDDNPQNVDGSLSSQHTFGGGDAAGTWHVIVCEPTQTPPSTYDSNWQYTILDDSFVVQSSAIPEFPVAWTVIVALALSAGVYLWLRRRMSPVPA